LQWQLFADMTFAQHKSQVHCFGNMQSWACISLNPLLCLHRQVAKLWSELLYYWPLLRNNNLTTNLRRCTSSHGDRRSPNYWTQTSWQQCRHCWGFCTRSGVFWLWSNFRNVCCITEFSIQEYSSFPGVMYRVSSQYNSWVGLGLTKLFEI